MIARFSRGLTRLFRTQRYLTGRAPEADCKTRADIKREILDKLLARMEQLDISKGQGLL